MHRAGHEVADTVVLVDARQEASASVYRERDGGRVVADVRLHLKPVQVVVRNLSRSKGERGGGEGG